MRINNLVIFCIFVSERKYLDECCIFLPVITLWNIRRVLIIVISLTLLLSVDFLDLIIK